MTRDKALPAVTVPTLSVILAGHIRVQIPASKEAQGVFDLLTPELKNNPDRHAFIYEDALAAGPGAVEMFRKFLTRSPQLRAAEVELFPSFATVEGRLFYIYLLPVTSS